MHVWVLFVAVVGVAGVILLLFFASKSAKSEQTWQKLDADTASVDHGQNVGGRRAKRKFFKRKEPPTVTGEPNSDVGLKKEHPRALWENRDYYWVVVCKNDGFHHRDNQFYVHRIPLAQTDAVSPRPAIDQRFLVRCDECGEEYVYRPSEVLRYEQEVPESFTPHPLFGEEN
jgi:hypothetical protein